MIKKKVDIKDVAKQCGVAVSTVSKAFNNRDGLVNKNTKERILKIAREMKYVPNAIARGLAMKRSENIGFIFKDIKSPKNNPFYADVFTGAALEANINNCNILFDSIIYDNSDKWNGELPKMILEKSVEGVIISGGFDLSVVKAIDAYGVHVVLVDNHFDNDDYDSVVIHNTAAAYNAVEHLIKLNHSNIGFIGGPLTNSSFKERFNGYKLALKDYNLILNKKNVLIDIELRPESFKLYTDKIMEILNRKNRSTAFFCSLDRLAINLIQLMKKNGFKVPDDFSIVGFDDLPECQYIDPPLTTIKVFRSELGSMGAKLLIERVFKQRKEHLTVRLSYELIERESCKKYEKN